MGQLALYYGNYADAATLSGGSWAAGLPLNNLKNRMLRRVVRSTNASTASTVINIDLGTAQSIPAIFLGPYNASGGLKYRIRGAANSGMTSPLYDSGTVGASVVPSLSLAWEDPGFWYGVPASGKVELRAWLQGQADDVLAAPSPRLLQRLAAVQDQVCNWLPQAWRLSVAGVTETYLSMTMRLVGRLVGATTSREQNHVHTRAQLRA